MTSVPQEHLDDAQKMEADGKVFLFEIRLAGGGVLHLKDNGPGTWQGVDYEHIAINLTGVGNSAGDEVYRPTLTIVNPAAVFSASVANQEWDRAIVVRREVLRENFDADANICVRKSWFISRPSTLNKTMIAFELRDITDSQNTQSPARMFMPPEFPQVSLT